MVHHQGLGTLVVSMLEFFLGIKVTSGVSFLLSLFIILCGTELDLFIDRALLRLFLVRVSEIQMIAGIGRLHMDTWF